MVKTKEEATSLLCLLADEPSNFSTEEILSKLDEYIKLGADVNAENFYYGPIVSCFLHVDPCIIKFLVEKGANINILSKKGGESFLSRACAWGCPAEKIEQYIKFGADVNVRSSNGTTPIFNIFGWDFYKDPMWKSPEETKNAEKVFDILIAHGADPCIANNKGENLLFYTKNKYVIEKSLSLSVDINKITNDDETLADRFIRDPEHLLYLIEKGLKIRQDEKHLTRLLFRSIWYKKLDDNSPFGKLFAYLLSVGADINSRSEEGDSILAYADSSSDVEYLIKKGARQHSPNKKGIPSIVYNLSRIYWDNPESLTELIKYIDLYASIGFDLTKELNVFFGDSEKRILKCRNFLFYLIRGGCPVTVIQHVLSNYELDINAEDEKGNTVLWYALQKHNRETLIPLLLKNGIDVKHKNKQGETPFFEYSFRKKKRNITNVRVISLLIDAGIDINAVNEKGETAKTVAEKYTGNTILINMLLERGYCPPINSSNIDLSKLLVSSKESENKQFWKTLKKEMVNGFLKQFPKLRYTFIKSAIENHVEIDFIAELLKKETRSEEELLMYAIKKKNAEVAKFLSVKITGKRFAHIEDITVNDYIFLKKTLGGSDLETVKFLYENNLFDLKNRMKNDDFLEMCNNLSIVKYLISKGAKFPHCSLPSIDLDTLKFYVKNDNLFCKDTMLFRICRNCSCDSHKDIEHLKFLLDSGVDINIRNVYKETPLLAYMCNYDARRSFYWHHNIDFFRTLMSYKPDISARDCKEKNAFQYFLEEWVGYDYTASKEMALSLFTKENSSPESLAYYYFYTKDLEKLFKLLDSDSSLCSQFTRYELLQNFHDNIEALKKFLSYGHTNTSKLIVTLFQKYDDLMYIEKVIEECSLDVEYNPDLLCSVCKENNHKIAEYLIKEKGIKDKNDGYTCFMAAASNANIPLAKLLLANGANVNAKDKDKWDALRFVLKSSSENAQEFLAFLLSCKPKLTQDTLKRTPLLFAAQESSFEMFKMIYDYDNSKPEKKKVNVEKALVFIRTHNVKGAIEKEEFLREKLAELCS